jgi:hypothetical protein
MPLQGAMMIGVSQTIEKGATQGYEYLRLEPRPDGVFYVASPPGKPEAAFRFEGQTVDKAMDRNDAVFTFVNPKLEYPQRIAYRAPRKAGCMRWSRARSAERSAKRPIRCAVSTANRASSSRVERAMPPPSALETSRSC